MSVPSDPLIRFVTDGLTASVDAYLAGSLPLHRLARELAARVDTLAALGPPARTLTRLRWLHRAVDLVHAAVLARAGAGGRAEPTRDEQQALTDTLADLRTVLATLTPHHPLDPAGAARPPGPALAVPA